MAQIELRLEIPLRLWIASLDATGFERFGPGEREREREVKFCFWCEKIKLDGVIYGDGQR
jgi:hypothetical protein